LEGIHGYLREGYCSTTDGAGQRQWLLIRLAGVYEEDLGGQSSWLSSATHMDRWRARRHNIDRLFLQHPPLHSRPGAGRLYITAHQAPPSFRLPLNATFTLRLITDLLFHIPLLSPYDVVLPLSLLLLFYLYLHLLYYRFIS
jgi:hypothetical protein